MWPPFESCFSHWVSSPGGFSLWMVVRPRTRPTLRSGSNTGGTLPMASDCPVAQWLLHAPQWPVERQAGHTALVRSRGLRSSSHSQCDHTRVALGVATGCVHARRERPRRHFPDSEKYFGSIPEDAVLKSGSGGQLMAFVPSLDLVVTRQTGGSGEWQYEEFLAKVCECVL